MRNECTLHISHKRPFLPMLCSKPSIKDVTLPRWEDRSPSFSGDPLSPKVGCMGQVKRNSRVSGFPTSHTRRNTSTTNNNNVKYLKLKKLFSGKNLSSATTPNSTSFATVVVSGGSCRRQMMMVDGSRRQKNDDNKGICVENMDPPLPVIKKMPTKQSGQEEESLWKRRCRGTALQSLELQKLHLCKNQHQPPTV